MATTEMQKIDGNHQHASGVQELIDRLRNDGVAKGRSEADAVLADARQAAIGVLDEARREAEQVRAGARAEAQQLRSTAEDALRLAARDAIIALNEALRAEFTRKVRKLVSHTMQDRAFLEKLILEVARRAMPEDAGAAEILLPNTIVTTEELKKNPQELAENSLSRFVLQLSSEVLRQGLTFVPAEDDRPGIRVQLKDEDVELDLTDEAVAELLMAHLSPRFRALMERPQA